MIGNKMDKNKIFLCSLTHTRQGYTSEIIPYQIGCIKGYVHSFVDPDIEISLFNDPDKLNEAYINGESPAIIGFSNFLWNLKEWALVR